MGSIRTASVCTKMSERFFKFTQRPAFVNRELLEKKNAPGLSFSVLPPPPKKKQGLMCHLYGRLTSLFFCTVIIEWMMPACRYSAIISAQPSSLNCDFLFRSTPGSRLATPESSMSSEDYRSFAKVTRLRLCAASRLLLFLYLIVATGIALLRHCS